jgi:hypothetical protein
VQVSVSQPLPVLPSQSPLHEAQVTVHPPQVPLTQVGVPPPGQLQALLQAPQCVMLVFLSVSQPLFGLPSQSR